MNKYDAEYRCIYTGFDGSLMSARRKIAEIINDDWIYSMHWNHDTWIKQARKDVLKRIKHVTDDLKSLETAVRMLDEIED